MEPHNNQRCIEKKSLLSGAVHQYSCELIALTIPFGMLRYTIEQEYTVGSIRLSPGDITYALYWTDRPYTLYVWHLKGATKIVYYFNIADRISLGPDEFLWRDLVVDILIDSEGTIHVLDEDEIPPDLLAELLQHIERVKAHLLSHYREIIDEATVLLKNHASQ